MDNNQLHIPKNISKEKGKCYADFFTTFWTKIFVNKWEGIQPKDNNEQHLSINSLKQENYKLGEF